MPLRSPHSSRKTFFRLPACHAILRFGAAEGLPPKISARDADETMKLSFAAERSVGVQQPVRIDELEKELLAGAS